MSTAELAGTEFQAEKLNIKFAAPLSRTGVICVKEMESVKEVQRKFKNNLKIPRRPPWNSLTTPEELDQNEKEHFLEWRRSLAQLQEEEGILLTPYEKNLEFWRQLWRVVERSDVIVQIVDARNPLLFRCEDLEKYVTEVSADKINLILVNKADFLTESQREIWKEYFSVKGIQVAFFSAHLAATDNTEKNEKEKDVYNVEDISEETGRIKNEYICGDNEGVSEETNRIDVVRTHLTNLETAVNQNADSLTQLMDRIEEIIGKTHLHDSSKVENSSKLLSRDELINLFRNIHQKPKVS